MFRNIISGAIIVVVALIVGFRPGASVLEWVEIIAIALLFTLAVSWLSAILGLVVKTLEAAQWIGFVLIFPLTFISSAFVETSTLPSGLRAFADNQPLTHVMNAVRSLTLGEEVYPMGNSLRMSIIWCVGLIAISIPITAALFKRRSAQG